MSSNTNQAQKPLLFIKFSGFKLHCSESKLLQTACLRSLYVLHTLWTYHMSKTAETLNLQKYTAGCISLFRAPFRMPFTSMRSQQAPAHLGLLALQKWCISGPEITWNQPAQSMGNTCTCFDCVTIAISTCSRGTCLSKEHNTHNSIHRCISTSSLEAPVFPVRRHLPLSSLHDG